MSCTITPSTPADVKIEIMLSNAAMTQYKKDYYGMTNCRVAYDYAYLADLQFLLEYAACGEATCSCYCNCSYQAIQEKINTL